MDRSFVPLVLCVLSSACANDGAWDRNYALRDLAAPDMAETPTPDRARDLVVEARALANEASVTLDAALLDRAHAALATAMQTPGHEGWIHYHAAYVEYLYLLRALYAPGVADRDAEFDRHVGAAVAHADAALESGVNESESAALAAAICGQRIAREGWLGMTLGPRSDELIERALRADPNNPRASLVNGSSLLHKPAMFGGDEEKALKAFERAAELFDSYVPADDLHPDWGRAEAHAWRGQALIALDRDAEAKAAFERALEIAPNYAWVRQELLPKVERKIAAKRGG